MVASFSSSTYFIFRYGIFRCTSVLATEAEADAVAMEVEVEVEVDASAVEEAEASNFAMERETGEEKLESELKEVLELALASALLGSTVL